MEKNSVLAALWTGFLVFGPVGFGVGCYSSYSSSGGDAVDDDADAVDHTERDVPDGDADAVDDTERDVPDGDGGGTTAAECSADGWCWSNPLPQGNSLAAVWGSGPSDVWAVGIGGTILRWNGSAWAGVSSGTTQDLYGVWGSGPSDVWAVGWDSTIVRWNGRAWAGVSSGTTEYLLGVWGSGPSDVWAVGGEWGRGTILRWNDSAWAVVSSGTM